MSSLPYTVSSLPYTVSSFLYIWYYTTSNLIKCDWSFNSKFWWNNTQGRKWLTKVATDFSKGLTTFGKVFFNLVRFFCRAIQIFLPKISFLVVIYASYYYETMIANQWNWDLCMEQSPNWLGPISQWSWNKSEKIQPRSKMCSHRSIIY